MRVESEHSEHAFYDWKRHNTRNVRWMGMHKDCVKEDASSEEESSISDSAGDKKLDDDGIEIEEDSLDEMEEVTEAGDSEQSIETQMLVKRT